MKSSVSMWIWIIGGILIGAIIFTLAYSQLIGTSMKISEQRVLEQYVELGDEINDICNSYVGQERFYRINLNKKTKLVYLTKDEEEIPENPIEKIKNEKTSQGNKLCVLMENEKPRCKDLNCKAKLTYIGAVPPKESLLAMTKEMVGIKPSYNYNLCIRRGKTEVVSSVGVCREVSTTSSSSTTTTTIQQKKDILIYVFICYPPRAYAELDQLKAMLRNNGYKVYYVERCQKQDFPIKNSLISKYDQIWFIDHEDHDLITQGEVNTVIEYYKNGGSLLLSGESGPPCCYGVFWLSANIQKIAKKFDVFMGKCLKTIKCGPGISGVPCFNVESTSHPIMNGVNALCTSTTDVIMRKTNPNVKTIARYIVDDKRQSPEAKGEPMTMVLDGAGNKGKIIFDSSFYRFEDTNPAKTKIGTMGGLKVCNDKRYALNIANWLNS